jgi:Fe-Mn family superoxide dismutase
MYPYSLPPLAYDYAALEPHIDARTMEIHHGKHHATYVQKLNAALEKAPSYLSKPIDEVIRAIDSMPQEIRTAVKNHGGGHFNHSLFWNLLSPKGGGKPSGSLATSVDKTFGSFDAFKEQFSTAAANLFGSGWAWLCVDKSRKLVVATMPNQDAPLMQGLTPVLGLDVWEHAYYLKYQNRRPEYIAAFWNIVNWAEAARHFDKAMG